MKSKKQIKKRTLKYKKNKKRTRKYKKIKTLKIKGGKLIYKNESAKVTKTDVFVYCFKR